jgi:hypothetical protein
VVEGGETKRGHHAPKRAETALERVRHARPYRWRWSERRQLVEDGDADESSGEERVMQKLGKDHRSRTEKLKQKSIPKITVDTVEGRGEGLLL